MQCLTTPESSGYNIFCCAACRNNSSEPWSSPELEKKTICAHCSHRHYRDVKVVCRAEDDDDCKSCHRYLFFYHRTCWACDTENDFELGECKKCRLPVDSSWKMGHWVVSRLKLSEFDPELPKRMRCNELMWIAEKNKLSVDEMGVTK